MSRFGPLVCHWTMRFEARHKWFKRLAVQLGNFINIAYTLAIRHQQLQCYQQLGQQENERVQIGPGNTITKEAFPDLLLDASQTIYR